MTLPKPVLYFTNGSRQEVLPANKETFTLEELQGFVGGTVQFAYLADGRIIVVNDDGKVLNLPFNAAATALFNQGDRLWYDPIMGNALVAHDDYLSDHDDDEDDDYDFAEFPDQ